MSHRVVVLVLDGAKPLDVGIPAQVFAARPTMPYRVRVCGAVSGLVTGGDGLSYHVAESVEAFEHADTIFIPGYREPVTTEPPAEVVAALRAAYRRGTRLAAISTGAFALAATGLLDGRRATTHWHYTRALAERHPSVDVDENVLFVDEGGVLTSAGAASGIDLCLHLVRRDHGVGLSNIVARRLVAAPYRSGGQAQYVPRSVPEPLGDVFAGTREWAPARRTAHPGGAGRQRPGFGAHLLPAVRRGHRIHPDAVSAARPRRPGPGAARTHRPSGGADRRPGRSGHCRQPAPALPAHPRHVADRVPPHVLVLSVPSC